MMQFKISSEGDAPEFVDVVTSHIGKGVYATRGYPNGSVIGEISGERHKDPYMGTSYTFEADHGYQLEPFEPFRYLNHSCEPNCEFDWIDEPQTDTTCARSGLFLIATRDIQKREQFTIDYCWPAAFAIPCYCNHPKCRGWIVAKEELERI